MSVREYIGARYIPLFADPIEWDSTTAYEPLTVVKNQGNSYISRQYVPEGISITNENYWILWADFNAQLEQYRREVQQFDGRITANTNAIANETEARATADSALSDDIAENAAEIANNATAINNEKDARIAADASLEASVSEKATIATYAPTPFSKSEQQKFFFHGENYSPNSYASVVTDEGSFKTSLFSGAYRHGSQSNIDVCASITLANTYLANADKFVYGNQFTGIGYGGTFDAPVRIDPRAHADINGRMEIDCNTFTQLIGHGVTYDFSTYNRANSYHARGLHPMFDDLSPVVKEYWRYGIGALNDDMEIGAGRMLSDAFAKFLFDSGQLEIIDPGHVESLVPGKIYFAGDIEQNPDRFLGITHCAIIAGFVGYGYAHKIVAESGSAAHPLWTAPLANTLLATKTVAAFTPNWSAGLYLHTIFNDRATKFDNVNLSANPISFDFTQGSSSTQYGARVVSIASSSWVPVNITATNSDTGATVSITKYASIMPEQIYLPYGWSVAISSSNTTAVNVICETCSSDHNLIKASS